MTYPATLRVLVVALTACVLSLALPVRAQSTFSSANVSVALIIDSSESMRVNDPQGLRKSAAKLFIDLLQLGDKVAVIKFDSSATTLAPLTTIRTPADRATLKTAVDRVTNSGGTVISDGLYKGYEQLLLDMTSDDKGAVVFTDADATYNSQVARYTAKGWPIHVIALNTENAVLERIAAETGGRSYSASDNTVLQDIIIEIVSLFHVPRSDESTDAVLLPNQSLVFTTEIPDDTAQVTVTTSWMRYTFDMRLVLPSGQIIEAATVPPGVYHTKAATYEVFRVDNPEVGEWRIEVTGIGVPADGEPVALDVQLISRYRYLFLPVLFK